VPLTVLAFLVLALVEARAATPGGWRQRLGLYLSAGLMFYIAVSGLAGLELISILRYTFCVHARLAPAAAHPPSAPPAAPARPRPWALPALAAALLVSLLLQIQFIRMYTDGQWVA